MLLTLIFVLSIQGAKAAECNSGIPPLSDGLSEILNLADPIALAHWTVSPTQFHSAPCKSKSPPELDEIDEYLFSKTGSQSKTISGVRFEGESKESLQALKNLFDGEDFEGVLTAEPACNKVVCAVERVWGAELGKKILYMRLRHGFNGSEYAHNKSSRFTVAEINDVLTSLRDLPAHLSNMGEDGDQKLIVAARGVTHSNPDAYADAAIFLYNRWRKDVGVSPYLTQYALFHEYAHNVSDKFGDADGSSQWKELNAREECRVSNYGNTNKVEDFAESVTMYRFGGVALQLQCPDKYNYIREKFFNGVEYLSEATCAGQ